MSGTETAEQIQIGKMADEYQRKAEEAIDERDRKWLLHKARATRQLLEGRTALRTFRNEETGRVRHQLGRVTPKVRRNDPCPCGSTQKFKRCHGRDH